MGDADGNGVISLNEGQKFGSALEKVESSVPSQSNQQTDEVDRLRAELEMLRKEARVLKASIPRSQGNQSRSKPATGYSQRSAQAVLSRSRGNTGSSVVSRGSETM